MSPDENAPSGTPDQAAPEQTGEGSQADQAGQQHGDGDNVSGGDVVHGDKIVQSPEGDAEVDLPDDAEVEFEDSDTE